MLQFGPQSAATGNINLIPHGTLAWAVMTVKAIKIGKAKDDGSPGSRFAEIEYTVAAGPYERRKVFSNIGDPSYQHNSENYRNMGFGAISRAMESSGLVNFQDPNSYSRFNGKSFDEIMQALDGKTVAVRIGIKKGTGGYNDANQIAEHLTPNPASTSSRDFTKLISGQTGSAPTQPPAAPVAAAPAWVAPPNSAQPPVHSAPAPVQQNTAGNWLAQAQTKPQ